MRTPRHDTMITGPELGDTYHWLRRGSNTTYCGLEVQLPKVHPRIGIRMQDVVCFPCSERFLEED